MRASRVLALFGSLATLMAAPACQDDTAESTSRRAGVDESPGAHGAAGDGASSTATGAHDASTSPVTGEVGPPAAASEPYVPFDINHVLSTGQSNAVANDGKPILSTTPSATNLMFDTGVMTAGSCDGDGCRTYQKPTAFTPLVEGDTFFYPVETMSSGLANQASRLASARGTPHTILVSLHARSGNSYGCLRKGGCGWWPTKNYVEPFEEGMRQVADAKAIAAAMGKSYVVRAVTAIHGEHDHYAYESGASAFPMTGTDGTSTVRDYADALLEWQRDYETGARAITAQTQPVPLFVSQYSHWNNVPATRIATMQLDAHVRSSGKVVVVGPTYALPYTNGCLHFTGHGERHLGEYFAKAYERVVVQGRPWEPLRPIAVTLAGNIVTARFHVPVPPLVLDVEKVDDPGNYGFEWSDASGAPPAITKVAITAPDTVEVTLAASPTGAGRRLRYAYTFRGCSSPRSIARGNLRDSDTTPSTAGYDLSNWAVHFDAPIL